MKILDVINFIESWAPKQISWDKDNAGLQIGSRDVSIDAILLVLDVDDQVFKKAVRNSANLIISHHPLIFNPHKNLDFGVKRNQLIKNLIKHEITLYSAHTNLDFTKDGVSFALAQKLGLKGIDFIENIPQTQYKIVTFVPQKNLETVLTSLSTAGAGLIGEYSNCSFQTEGIGTFRGSELSNPSVGKKGKLEKVAEVKLEMIFEKWKLNALLKALHESHPYEEPAYDIYPLENKNVNFGYGAFGILDKQVETEKFIRKVKTSLNAPSVKWTRGKLKPIQKVGVCGGSGSDLIQSAIAKKCDAFVTSDVKYHTFQDYEDEIVLIDVDHYYSEAVILEVFKNKLEKFFKSQNVKVPVEIYYQQENKIRVL